MPSVPIYIRQSDYEKWLAIEDKPSFLHNALWGVESVGVTPVAAKPRKEVGSSPATTFVPKPPDPRTGYPCCTKRSPCKHWHWSDIDEVWQNELTGKTRVE